MTVYFKDRNKTAVEFLTPLFSIWVALYLYVGLETTYPDWSSFMVSLSPARRAMIQGHLHMKSPDSCCWLLCLKCPIMWQKKSCVAASMLWILYNCGIYIYPTVLKSTILTCSSKFSYRNFELSLLKNLVQEEGRCLDHRPPHEEDHLLPPAIWHLTWLGVWHSEHWPSEGK